MRNSIIYSRCTQINNSHYHISAPIPCGKIWKKKKTDKLFTKKNVKYSSKSKKQLYNSYPQVLSLALYVCKHGKDGKYEMKNRKSIIYPRLIELTKHNTTTCIKDQYMENKELQLVLFELLNTKLRSPSHLIFIAEGSSNERCQAAILEVEKTPCIPSCRNT